MRVVVVDDEPNVRDTLKTLLEIYASDLKVVGEANGIHTGIACIKKHKPDLVLLDVEMQDGTGFDLLSIYGDVDFQVIFVTGHESFAIKAFKFSALDYILKPVDPDDLVKAIDKARSSHTVFESKIKIKSLIENRTIADQKN